MTVLFPANELDAVLVSDADSATQFPLALPVRVDGTLGDVNTLYRSQFEISPDGTLYRVLVQA